MFRYPLIFIMNFCYEKKCSFSRSLSFCIIEEIRKIFLSRNLSLNMPKNVLISLKNCKNRQTLGLCSQTPLPPAAGGSAPRPPHQSSYIVNYSLCICPQKHRNFRIKPKYLFSCNYSGSVQDFRRSKNYAAFRLPQTT